MKRKSSSNIRKPLESIESLLFVLGGILTWLLLSLNHPIWLVIIVVLTSAVFLEKLVNYLRKKNRQVFS